MAKKKIDQFLRLEHKIWEYKMPPLAKLMLIAIRRWTAGFHRNKCKISDAKITEMTGIKTPYPHRKFLIENETLIIQIYESYPVSIVLPDTISLEVIEADAIVKGQTAASSYKPAVLERNIKTSVPPFIKIGDKVVISTNDSTYLEKAKNLK